MHNKVYQQQPRVFLLLNSDYLVNTLFLYFVLKQTCFLQLIFKTTNSLVMHRNFSNWTHHNLKVWGLIKRGPEEEAAHIQCLSDKILLLFPLLTIQNEECSLGQTLKTVQRIGQCPGELRHVWMACSSPFHLSPLKILSKSCRTCHTPLSMLSIRGVRCLLQDAMILEQQQRKHRTGTPDI